MINIALTRSAKTSCMLVELTYGSPAKVARYTDWTSHVDFYGRIFTSTPTMEIEWPTNTGGLREEPFGVVLPLDALTDQLSSGEPHARVFVSVREYVRSVSDVKADPVFVGYVERAIRTYRGLPNSVRLDCVNVKQLLDVALGMQATVDCGWKFGSTTCGVNAIALRETRSILRVNGSTLTMGGIDDTKQWVRGWVEVDGLRISIREHSGQLLTLRQQPPRRWWGQSALCQPGCRKTVEDCEFYSNVGNFNGNGMAMPDRQPLLEVE